MKAKAWAAVVMVAFAWGLWSKISSVGIEKWSPEQGFDSKEECEKFAVSWIDHVISKDPQKERLAINPTLCGGTVQKGAGIFVTI